MLSVFSDSKLAKIVVLDLREHLRNFFFSPYVGELAAFQNWQIAKLKNVSSGAFSHKTGNREWSRRQQYRVFDFTAVDHVSRFDKNKRPSSFPSCVNDFSCFFQCWRDFLGAQNFLWSGTGVLLWLFYWWFFYWFQRRFFRLSFAILI